MEYICDEGHTTVAKDGNYFVRDEEGNHIGKFPINFKNEMQLETGMCPVCDPWAFDNGAA